MTGPKDKPTQATPTQPEQRRRSKAEVDWASRQGTVSRPAEWDVYFPRQGEPAPPCGPQRRRWR